LAPTELEAEPNRVSLECHKIVRGGGPRGSHRTREHELHPAEDLKVSLAF
jgi:hypothetical protein